MSYPEYKMGIIDDSEWARECRDILPDDAVPKERCENCVWYHYVERDDEWVCINRDSEWFGEQMDDTDYCDCWERK